VNWSDMRLSWDPARLASALLEACRAFDDEPSGCIELAGRRIYSTEPGRFDPAWAVIGILDGDVEPEWGGRTPDPDLLVQALALGAYMSPGKWWFEESWTRLTSSTPDAVARELAALAGSDATEDDGEQLRDHMTRWGLLRRRSSAAEIVEIVELSDDEWHDLIVWALS
jgi:hypothetical protein